MRKTYRERSARLSLGVALIELKPLLLDADSGDDRRKNDDLLRDRKCRAFYMNFIVIAAFECRT